MLTSPMRPRDWIFALSGAASLIDQVVWMRWLGRQLGSDALGASLTVGVFLAGLALGAAWGARPAASTGEPAKRYAWLSLWVALWALASGPLLQRVGPVDSLGARALASALVLLPPTIAMGALFPLMGRLCVENDAERGARTGAFYGANTLGAAAGALAAPFLLLPSLGLSASLWAGAALDALAGAGAAFGLLGTVDARTGAARPAAAPRPAPGSPASESLDPGRGAAVVALLGASALAFEVIQFRALTALTGASVHAQGIVLGVFLIGLGGGARSAAGWLQAGRDPRALLARCAAAAAAGGLLGVVVLEWRLGGSLYRDLRNWMPNGLEPARLWLAHAFLAAALLLPATWAFGAALPAAIAATRVGSGGTEALLARLYGVNSLASAAGALLAGWWAVPRFGLHGALAWALLLAALASVLALPKAAALRVLPFGALLVLWSSGALRGTADSKRWTVLHERHGTVSSATVVESPDGRERGLRVSGKVVATTAPVDLRLQRLLGALPALLAGQREEALVIGLGTGTTAGALLAFDELERLDLVELSGAVASAAPWFAAENAALLDDPRTDLILADGRAFARGAAGRATYGVVTADPIHPWTRGSSDLYSREHFSRLGALLTEDGVASQWLPLYQLSTADVRVVLATWCAAFDHAAAYCSAYDLVLLGSRGRRLDPEALLAARWPERLKPELARCGLRSPAELAALFTGDRADLLAFAGDARPMGEDRPVLEFSAPRSFLAGYSIEALAWAARPALLERVPPDARPAAERFHAELERFLAELPSGSSAAAQRYGERLVAPH
jgi:spermidine synthase